MNLEKLRLLVPLICILSAGILMPFGDADPSTDEPVATAPSAVHALGRLEPAGRVLELGVPSGNEGSCVADLKVQEGQHVVAGQVLALMDTFPLKAARVAETKARLEAARARLRQVSASAKEAELEAARAEVQRLAHRVEASRRLHLRLATLRAEGIVAAEDADDARAWLAQHQQEHRRAMARLSGLDEVRRVDLDLRQAEVAVAEAAVVIARAELETARVRAPQPGTVLRVHARPGEKPGAAGLLQLADVRRIQAVAEVFEGDLARVDLGRPAEVELFSTGEHFAGRVAAVGSVVGRKSVLSNDPVSDTDARIVEVRVDLDEESSSALRRLSNARVLVRIETSETASPAEPKGLR